jgi:hypothetical protein
VARVFGIGHSPNSTHPNTFLWYEQWYEYEYERRQPEHPLADATAARKNHHLLLFALCFTLIV